MKKYNIQLTNEEKAYIAGFLDGDGHILAQIIKGDAYKYKFNIRFSIIFLQKQDRHNFMQKLNSMLKFGYLRIRKDNISEYTITGSESVEIVLKILNKYIILKKELVNLILHIIDVKKSIKNKEDFIKLCELVDQTSKYNYSKKRTVTASIVKNYLMQGVETLT